MRFEFATATRVIFGAGTLREAGGLAREFGQRALIVTGRDTGRAAPLIEDLARVGGECTVFGVEGEPTFDTVTQGLAVARQAGCEVVIGLGGGSALDTAKAIAALLTNGGALLDYAEVVGRGQPLWCASAPLLAIPTTAGTGAEVTRNAVLAAPEHHVKVSLRSPFLLPRVALVDPELMLGLPPARTASTGLDALTQLIEPYVSHRANPLTDGLCVEGLRRAARALRVAFHEGGNLAARTDLALASLLSGLALANAGLGAVHGLAAPIGGQFPAPHGAVCAALLPRVMHANVRALRARAAEDPALGRYDQVARLLTGNTQATASEGIAWVEQLVKEFGIPALSCFGLRPEHTGELCAKAATASSMRSNPIELTPEELAEILTAAL